MALISITLPDGSTELVSSNQFAPWNLKPPKPCPWPEVWSRFEAEKSENPEVEKP